MAATPSVRTTARRVALGSTVVLGMSQPAAACGICVMGMGEYVLPGIMYWFWWGIAWFVSMSVARSALPTPVPWVPRAWFAVPVAMGAALVGSAFLGFLPVIPLAAASLAGTVWSFVPWSAADPGRRRLQITGALGLALGLGLAGYSIRERIGQTDVDYVCRWPSGPITRSLQKKWQSDEPQSIALYRQIVRRSSQGAAVEAAKRLGEIGDADDALLLEGLLSRLSGGMSWGQHDVADAIARIRSRSAEQART